MIRKLNLLFPLFFVLLLSLLGNSLTVRAVPARKDFMSLSFILDNTYGYEDLASRLTALNFHNFTFAVLWGSGIPDYWLGNNTRQYFLRDYGVLIPDFGYLQEKTPAERVAFIDGTFDVWRYWSGGSNPKGYMTFIPDTFVNQYLVDHYNCTYVQGYCLDQYTIDYMTQRGGWQLPYYGSVAHVLKPSDVQGMVVFPHVTWDWISSFTVAHYYNTHIQNVMIAFGGDVVLAKDYWLKLIDRSLTSCSPFGFVSVQWEWCGMISAYGYQAQAFDWLSTVLANPLYTFWTYEAVAEWFLTNYASNPVYRVSFTSPFNNAKVEWYWSSLKRVCRVRELVVSYVDYVVSDNDKYRMTSQTIAWGESWENNPSNCIDTTLYACIKVDALGGGLYRFGASRFCRLGEGVAYAGDLAAFVGLTSSVSLLWYQDPVTFGLIIIGVVFAVFIFKGSRL